MPPLSARVKDQTILVIDDTPENLTLMRNLLSESYFVKIAPGGERGLDIAKSNYLDLILPSRRTRVTIVRSSLWNISRAKRLYF